MFTHTFPPTLTLRYSSGDEGLPESSPDSRDLGDTDTWGVGGGLLKLGSRGVPVTRGGENPGD